MRIQKLFDAFFGLITFLCKAMIMLQVICVTIVVIGRYVFNVTPAWGEELTLFCLVWMSLMGAALALRDNSHLRITMFDSLMSPKVISALNLLGDIVVSLFAAAIFWYGISMTKQVSRSILYGMHISKGYLYAAVPAAGAMFLIVEIERIFKWFYGRKERDAK